MLVRNTHTFLSLRKEYNDKLGKKKTCGKDTVKIGKLLLSRVNVLVKPLFDEFFSSFYLMLS